MLLVSFTNSRLWRVFFMVPNMDILFLNELRIATTIGVYAWEQAITQHVLIDLEIATNSDTAASTDNIDDALNYATVAERVTQFVSTNKYQLLETLAEQVAQFLHQEFQVTWLRLRVAKPGAVANAKQVGVIIERNF